MRQNVYEYAYELKRERQHTITRRLVIFLCTVFFLSVFARFVLFSVLVRSDSMEIDIPEYSALFVAPLARYPKRGNVVYLKPSYTGKNSFIHKVGNGLSRFLVFPQYFSLNKKNSETFSVRRVLGLPGDSIYMKDYVLYVKPNGSDHYLTEFEISDKPYNPQIHSVPDSWDGLGSIGSFDEITLGDGQYFVLADNRIDGTDSRVWGPVNQNRIGGSVVLEYFPFNHMKRF